MLHEIQEYTFSQYTLPACHPDQPKIKVNTRDVVQEAGGEETNDSGKMSSKTNIQTRLSRGPGYASSGASRVITLANILLTIRRQA